MRKQRYPLRNIRTLLETEQGQVGWAYSIWFLLLMGLLLCASLQVQSFRTTGRYVEDALACSNLAALIVDVEEYGRSHEILLESPTAARDRFLTALRGNLNLDPNMRCPNDSLISGPVAIDAFIVYQVYEDRVEIFRFGPEGSEVFLTGLPGETFAPNGKPVTNTGVYSEISFPVRGFLGVEAEVHKGDLADIAVN